VYCYQVYAKPQYFDSKNSGNYDIMNKVKIKIIRRTKNNAPVLQRRNKSPILIRRSKPTLQRRTRPVLKRRPKPDVFYCAKKSIKNRLPYPIECSWIATMYQCCMGCTKKVVYGFWKQGGYSAIAKRLQDRTYKADPEEENEIKIRANFR